MPRTPAQLEAAERDEGLCLYHAHVKEMRVAAGEVHHISRRGKGKDQPDLCISLCVTCHANHHRGLEPTTAQLIDIMDGVYGYSLREKYRFLANRGDAY